MSRLFYHVCQDNVGNLLFDVSGTMRIAGSGTLATIYGDEALTVILPNPMTNHPSFGSFKCFLGSGDYDFYMAKAGYTFETLTGVQGHGTIAQQDASAVAITGGTAVLTRIGLGGLGADPVLSLNLQGDAVFTAGRIGVGTQPVAPHLLTIAGQTILNGNTGIAKNPATAFGYTLEVVGSAAKTGGGAWTDIASSATLKRDIRPIAGALETVRALRPRWWEWRAEQRELEKQMPGRQAGFVIEEMAEDLPEWVVTGQDGQHGLSTRGDIAYLVAAIKELAAQVEALTARLEDAGL